MPPHLTFTEETKSIWISAINAAWCSLALGSSVTAAWLFHRPHDPGAHAYLVSIEQIHLPSHIEDDILK